MKYIFPLQEEYYEVEPSNKRYSKYFTYWRAEGKDGRIYYDRRARPGYDYLEHDHRPIEEYD